MAISGLGVAYAVGGFVLVYSGWANQPIKNVLTGFLSGNPPPANPSGAPTIGVQDNEPSTSGTGGTPATTTGSAIADDALKYVGHVYVYGGPSNVNGGWDCSSFVNWVLGHDLNMAIPDGSWASETGNGTEHGPTTLSYLAWTGATTISNSSSAAVAGDLLCWETHIGIALGGGNMVSALDTASGTVQTTIAGGTPTGELLFVRRIKAAVPAESTADISETTLKAA